MCVEVWTVWNSFDIFYQPFSSLGEQITKRAEKARTPLSLFLSVSMSNTDAYMNLFLKVQIWEQERKSLKLSLLCVLSSHYTVPFLKIQGKPNLPAPSKKHFNKVTKAPYLRAEKLGVLYNWKSHIIQVRTEAMIGDDIGS